METFLPSPRFFPFMGSIITVNDVAVRYEGHVVLDKFSMELNEGCCAGIIGINGAGKSTLLRVLLNLEPFDTGSFTILNLECSPAARARRLPAAIAARIGYVPQQAAFDDEMSAWDNLAFAGQLHYLHGVELQNRIRRVLALVHLVKDGDQ
nr:ATP-binding cassette domain-containing protein [Candidatus Sigynarchaeota archaeon]